jgi:multicomponent Na+:H+ antiporter subunit D
MKQISELAKREPVTGYTTLAGALSISGMPPFGGFWAKLMIIVACVQAGRPMLAFLSVLVGVLTLAYYFRAITPMLFRPSEARSPVIRKKIPFSMALPVLALAVISASSACLLLPNAGHILLNKAVEAIQNNSYYLLAVSGGM